MPPEKNNPISLLIDADEAWPRILARVDEARRSIHITMFIWRDDGLGNTLARRLLAAAGRGVKITIIKDKLGVVFEKAEENKQSFFHKGRDWPLWIRHRVVDAFYYIPGEPRSCRQRPNPLADELLRHPNITVERDAVRADHSKYYLIDDEVLILGGMNVEDKIFRDVSGRPWRDFMVELQGEALVRRFRDRQAGRVPIDPCAPVDFVFNRMSRAGAVREIKPAVLELLDSARQSVTILMAYLGDPEVTRKIVSLTRRGVAVTILLPARANIQPDFNLRVAREIFTDSGGRAAIHLTPDMLHAKLLAADGRRFLVGSANLNRQALEKLSELDVCFRDPPPELQERLQGCIERLLAGSRRVESTADLRYHRLRAWLERFFA